MFAVFVTGGKQFKVAEGDQLAVPKIEKEIGAAIELADVRLVSIDGKTVVGNPVVKNAKVTAEVVGHGREPKVIIFKKKRRQNYRRKKGHRQDFSVIKITKIAA